MNPTDCLGLNHLPYDSDKGLKKPDLTLLEDAIDYAKLNILPIAGISLALVGIVIG